MGTKFIKTFTAMSLMTIFATSAFAERLPRRVLARTDGRRFFGDTLTYFDVPVSRLRVGDCLINGGEHAIRIRAITPGAKETTFSYTIGRKKELGTFSRGNNDTVGVVKHGKVRTYNISMDRGYFSE